MIACLIAGVTSAETFMVGGSALFTRNFYVHAVPGRSHTHYLWVGRLASGGLLALGILLAVRGRERDAARARIGQSSSVCSGPPSGWAWSGAVPIPPASGPAFWAACWSGLS